MNLLPSLLVFTDFTSSVLYFSSMVVVVCTLLYLASSSCCSLLIDFLIRDTAIPSMVLIWGKAMRTWSLYYPYFFSS